MTERTLVKLAEVIREIDPNMRFESIEQTYKGDYRIITSSHSRRVYLIDRVDFRVKWIGKHQWGD